MTLGRSRRSLRLAVALTAVLAGSAAVAPSAVSVPPPADAACPDAYPTASLAVHQSVDGLTVSSGNSPDEFTGEVLGVLKDGIGPALDMIIVRLTSPEIDRVGGIWAGMSGSPVYAADGRLIGAVSYGLGTGPSPVAGVTPAADMKALLAGGSPAHLRKNTQTRPVRLSASVRRTVVAHRYATRAQADSGMTRLPLPLSISGMVSNARLKRAAKLLDVPDVIAYRAGSAPTAPLSPAAASNEIFAGSNLAASLAYGDLSAVAIGTTTMVCDGAVVGFGHPLEFTGDSTVTLHGADAVFVQEDPTVAGFKVANPTGPLGTINGDHLAGISGALGPPPFATVLHSQVRVVHGSQRTADTYVSVPYVLPDAGALAQAANQDRAFDRTAEGSALVRFTIDGRTANNKPFTLHRTNRFVDLEDISFGSVNEIFDDLSTITGNDLTDVTIEKVSMSTVLDKAVRAFSIVKIERRLHRRFSDLSDGDILRVRAGSTLRLRVTLKARRNALPKRTVMVRVKVPKVSRPTDAALTLGNVDKEGGGFGEPELGDGSAAPATFGKLLSELAAAPRNDQIVGTLTIDTRTGPKESTGTASAHDVVTGGAQFAVLVFG